MKMKFAAKNLAAVLTAAALMFGVGSFHVIASAEEKPETGTEIESQSLENVTSEKVFFLDNKITDSAIKNKTTVTIDATVNLQFAGVPYTSEWNFADLEKEAITLPDSINLTTLVINIRHHSDDSFAGDSVFQFAMETAGKTEEELNGFVVSARQESNGMLHYAINVGRTVLAEKYVSPDKLKPNDSSSVPAETIAPEESKVPADAVPAEEDQTSTMDSQTSAATVIEKKTETQSNKTAAADSNKAEEQKKDTETVDVKQAALPSVGSVAEDTVSKKTGLSINTGISKTLSPTNLLMIGGFVIASIVSVFILFKDELLKQRKASKS